MDFQQLNLNDDCIRSRRSNILTAEVTQNSADYDQSPKGLQNMPGENNCFLNSAVQVLWHLDAFRRNFRLLSTHYCQGRESCIFCALKVVFTQFQFSDLSTVVNDTLRRALANAFTDTQRYQLGHMDDAAECFENILQRLHFQTVQPHLCVEEQCHAAHCITHCKFAMQITEQITCQCGGHTQLSEYMQLVQYVSVSELVKQSFHLRNQGVGSSVDMFGQLIHKASSAGDVRDCPRNCGSSVQIRRTLLNAPEVVSVGLVWDSERADASTLHEMIKLIGTTIRLVDLFHFVAIEEESIAQENLCLFGVVCYYGKHYSTFVRHSKLKSWIYFDDARWRQVGEEWSDAAGRIAQSRYQPLLLLYTRSNSTLIDPSNALVQTEAVPCNIVPILSSNNSLSRRSLRNSCRSSSANDEGLLGGNPYLNNLVEDQKLPNAFSTTKYINTDVVKAVLQQRQRQRLSYQRQSVTLLAPKPSMSSNNSLLLKGGGDGGEPAVTRLQTSFPAQQQVHETEYLSQSDVLNADCPDLTSFEMMGFRQQYDDLCVKATLLVQRSQQQELSQDSNMALFHLTQATICYKQAMEIPYIGTDSRQEAKAAYFECQQRCQTLHANLLSSRKDSGLSSWSEPSDSTTSVESRQLLDLIKKDNSLKPAPPQRSTSIKTLDMDIETGSVSRPPQTDNNNVNSYCTLPRGKAAKQRQLQKQQMNQQRHQQVNSSSSKDVCLNCKYGEGHVTETERCLSCSLKMTSISSTSPNTRMNQSHSPSPLVDNTRALTPMLDTMAFLESSEAASLSARANYYQHVRENFHNRCYNEWPTPSVELRQHTSNVVNAPTSSGTSYTSNSPSMSTGGTSHILSISTEPNAENVHKQQSDLQDATLQEQLQRLSRVSLNQADVRQVEKPPSPYKQQQRFAIGATRPDKPSVLKKRKTRIDAGWVGPYSTGQHSTLPNTPAPATVNKYMNFTKPIVKSVEHRSSSTTSQQETVLCHLCVKKCHLEVGSAYCNNCLDYLRHRFVVNKSS